MCRITFHESGTCIHSWVTIVSNCAKDKNLSNCQTFTDRKYRRRALYGVSLPEMNQCPECDKENKYDGKQIRMIEAMETSLSGMIDVREEAKDKKVICTESILLQRGKALNKPACCVM